MMNEGVALRSIVAGESTGFVPRLLVSYWFLRQRQVLGNS